MISQFRRIVTGYDDSGRSVFIRQEPIPALRAELFPGTTYWKAWGTADGIPIVSENSENVEVPHFPGPGGSRIVAIEFAPSQEAEREPAYSGEKLAAMTAEANAKFPGLADAHEDGSPFHSSDTLDYAFVAEGELSLELDDGATEVLPAGSFVVQRGTRHAWSNRSDQPALVIFVVIGGRRA